ncbi:MAG: hypothetical protein HKN44_11940 [Ilumatobacter sp.]|nr:hypothetical protein [Ilumatobacter sp.]
MALLPYALRPSVIIRRKAIRQGILGPSRLWKVVAAFVFGRKSIKKFFGKNPERLPTQKIGANSFVNVINAKPMKPSERKAAGITKEQIRAQASADVAAAWARKAAAKPKRKVVRRAEKTAAMAAADRERARKKARKRAS